MTHSCKSPLLRIAALSAVVAAALAPVSAQAWWRGGVVIGLPPVVVAPPVVAYPPAYYPPPYYAPPYAPGYYPPPPGYGAPPAEGEQYAPQQTPAPELSQGNVPYGTTCYAGVYTCPAPYATHAGTGCSCPGLGAPSFGVVR